MTESAKNYTAEMETAMTERYTASPTRETVAALAAEFEKTERSVISKLSNLGVYQKAEATTKSGKPIVRKSELVAQINETFGIEVPSLEKASKADLEALVAAVSA